MVTAMGNLEGSTSTPMPVKDSAEGPAADDPDGGMREPLQGLLLGALPTFFRIGFHTN